MGTGAGGPCLIAAPNPADAPTPTPRRSEFPFDRGGGDRRRLASAFSGLSQPRGRVTCGHQAHLSRLGRRRGHLPPPAPTCAHLRL